MTNLSAAPEEIQEWQCPYCEQTRQTLSDLREHVTESTEGDHEGIDGLKPTRDLIAYGPNGQEVDRIEGVSTEPPNSIDQYDKREIIINAWIAADRDPDRKAVQSISGASQQYVSRLLNELESGEIPRETWIRALDYGLRDELAERLEDYEPDEDSSMSAQATDKDLIDESTKKERILALYKLNPQIDKKEAAHALDTSYEYVRQIFKDIEDREPSEWQKLQPGELDEDPDPQLVDAVEDRLREEGVLAGGSDAITQADLSVSASPPSASMTGAVPVEDVMEVREKMELLLEQAEYTGDQRVEFVARKGIEWIDELVESAS